ncbi:hypothetical protein, partial [Nocardioides abyssi]
VVFFVLVVDVVLLVLVMFMMNLVLMFVVGFALVGHVMMFLVFFRMGSVFAVYGMTRVMSTARITWWSSSISRITHITKAWTLWIPVCSCWNFFSGTGGD